MKWTLNDFKPHKPSFMRSAVIMGLGRQQNTDGKEKKINFTNIVIFYVYTVVNVIITVCWAVTLCTLTDGHQSINGTYLPNFTALHPRRSVAENCTNRTR